MNFDEHFFKERGFGQTIGFGKKPAVLVIDMLNAFTNEELPLGTNQDSQIIVINEILSHARQIDVPIFFISIHYDTEDISEAAVWFRKMKGLSTLKKDTLEVEIDSRIIRKPNEPIIIKKFASAFFGTDLAKKLKSIDVDTVVLTGCTTSGCVRATAVDVIQHGFRPIVIEDAVSDRSINAHQQSIFDLQAKYADVLLSEKIITYFNKLDY